MVLIAGTFKQECEPYSQPCQGQDHDPLIQAQDSTRSSILLSSSVIYIALRYYNSSAPDLARASTILPRLRKSQLPSIMWFDRHSAGLWDNESHRSISPSMMSIVPMATTTSAIRRPTHIFSSA